MATEGLPQSPSHVWIYAVLELDYFLIINPRPFNTLKYCTYVTLFILDNSYIYEGLNTFSGTPNIKKVQSVTPKYKSWAGSRSEQLLQAQTAGLSEGAEGVGARDRLRAQYIWMFKQIIVLCHLCKQHWALGLMQPRDMALPTEPLSLDSRCAHTHTHARTHARTHAQHTSYPVQCTRSQAR